MFLGFDKTRFLVATALTVALVAAGCGDDDDGSSAEGDTACFSDPGLEAIDISNLDPATVEGVELTMVTYDSFFVSEGIFDSFEDETGISVTILPTADTGTMVSQAVLTAGDPVADVMWGIDNTFLCRGLEADIFTPYTSSNLDSVPQELRLDPYDRVTPVDFSDMCVNYWTDALPGDPPL